MDKFFKRIVKYFLAFFLLLTLIITTFFIVTPLLAPDKYLSFNQYLGFEIIAFSTSIIASVFVVCILE